MSIPPTKVWLGKEECFLLGVGKRSIKWAQEFGALRSEGEAREEVHRDLVARLGELLHQSRTWARHQNRRRMGVVTWRM